MQRTQIFNLRFVIAAIIILAAISLSFFTTQTPASHAEPQKRTQRRRAPKTPPQPKIDYTNFSHQTHTGVQKLACNSCHKVPSKNWKQFRAGDAAFPDVTDFPEHSACLECHRTQFFARERPAPAICANCHIAVTPRDTARWLFPSLGDVSDPKLKRRDFISEFGLGFPHDKHLEVVGLNANSRPSFVKVSGVSTQTWGSDRVSARGSRLLQDQKKLAPDWSATVPVAALRVTYIASETLALQSALQSAPPKSCPVCHETYQPQGKSSEEYLVKPPKTLGDAFWLKKGTFKTIPNSHTICFTCHNADSGIPPEPKNCETCHKLAGPQQIRADFDAQLAASMGADRVMLAGWRRRISAGGFRHEGGEHPELSCLNCHKAASATFNPIDLKTLKVPIRSCGGADGCHVTATTDDGGALNYEIDSRKKDPKFVCTKCHVTFGKEPIPASHPQAIPTPKPKTN